MRSGSCNKSTLTVEEVDCGSNPGMCLWIARNSEVSLRFIDGLLSLEKRLGVFWKALQVSDDERRVNGKRLERDFNTEAR